MEVTLLVSQLLRSSSVRLLQLKNMFCVEVIPLISQPLTFSRVKTAAPPEHAVHVRHTPRVPAAQIQFFKAAAALKHLFHLCHITRIQGPRPLSCSKPKVPELIPHFLLRTTAPPIK